MVSQALVHVRRALRQARTRRLPRTLLVPLLAAAAVMLASGCGAYEEHFTIERNGGGKYEARMTLDAELVNLGELDLDPVWDRAQELADRWSDLAGWDITVAAANERTGTKGYYGVRLAVPFTAEGAVPLLDAIGTENDGANPADAASYPPAPVLTLAQQGDTFTLSGSIAPIIVAPVPGAPPVLAGRLAAARAAGPDVPVPALDDDTQATLKEMRRTLVLTLPGQVTAVNADRRNGNTYTWDIDLLNTNPSVIQVSWKPAGNPALSANPKPLPAGTAAAGATATPAGR